MPEPIDRISAEAAHEHVESEDALLVCAYEDPEKFEKFHLEGAISLQDFESQIDTVPSHQEIIFYCS